MESKLLDMRDCGREDYSGIHREMLKVALLRSRRGSDLFWSGAGG